MRIFSNKLVLASAARLPQSAVMASGLEMGNVVILFLFLALVERVSTARIEWNGPEWVADYKSYKDVSVFKFNVPQASTVAKWYFRAIKEPTSCDDKNVFIYLQYGSLPVLNPLNETFPSDFYLEKSHILNFTVKTDNVSLPVQILGPLPGVWYAVFFTKRDSSRINPKGLFGHCYYSLASTFEYVVKRDIETVLTQKHHHVAIQRSRSVLLRFYAGLDVAQYTLSISDCTVVGDVGVCNVGVLTRGQAIPNQHNSLTSTCSNITSTPCTVNVSKTNIPGYQYILLKSLGDAESINIQLQIITTECSKQEDKAKTNISLNSDNHCLAFPELDRYKFPGYFKTKFIYINNDTVQDNKYGIAVNTTSVISFDLVKSQDTGGSLILNLKLEDTSKTQDIGVHACVRRNRILTHTSWKSCTEKGATIHVNTSNGDSTLNQRIVIPYPKAGMWFIAMNMVCHKLNKSFESSPEPCLANSTEVRLAIASYSCVNNQCSGHGSCNIYFRGEVFFSSCHCEAGYQGYACSDDSQAMKVSTQLLELLLLTLSHVFFIPAITVALHRRYYVETLVYAYTMFFSLFYHACDGERTEQYKYCMMPYFVLSFCDFLGSATSIFVTIIAMAKLPVRFTVVLQVAAPLLISIGVLIQKTSMYLFIVPGSTGGVLLLLSWVHMCKIKRHCYPSWRRYLFYLLPGVIIAVVGLCIFSFVETDDNYKYTHSSWHAAMALCIVFLLPSRTEKGLFCCPRKKPFHGDEYSLINANQIAGNGII